MKHFMIAGLLAAIGAVVFAGQSHAGNRYCTYYPEDPNCYDALYGQDGQEDYGHGSYRQPPQQGYDDEEFDNEDYAYRPPPRMRQVASCESVGHSLRRYGYSHVRPVDCGAKNYKYVAYLGYQRFMVKVNSRNGAIVYEINY